MTASNKWMKHLPGEKVALYGLGIETEKLLGQMEDDSLVVGLLDGFRETGVMYGKPILSLDMVLQNHVKKIIVVARPGSAKAIAKRIGDFCREHQIELMDVRGKDLLRHKTVKFDFGAFEGITKDELREKLETAEVVTVDLFDTLIMRNTLFSTDVIDIAAARWEEKGIVIPDFSRKRLAYEKELSQKGAPKLTKIYTSLLKSEKMTGVSAEEFAALEYETDLRLLVPRRELCELLTEFHGKGKAVYIVTDTYYTREQIMGILKQCGIACYDKVFISCEEGTGKTQKLFDMVGRETKGRVCIHIGDDVASDVEPARNHGITPVHIYSGQDLFDMLGGLGLSDFTDDLSDRIRVGMLAADLFNSPFLFEYADKKIRVFDSYHVGYLFCAPMIVDFVLWFQKQMETRRCENIWFCARDGYLIQKLFQYVEKTTDTRYFLTSRIAAIRAGVSTESDIRYVDEMKFSGTAEACLKERFGIDAEKEISVNAVLDGEGMLKYKEAILRNARIARSHYMVYIKKLGIKPGDIAFFDFVAKGTCQMFVERLVSNPLRGFYFLQVEADHMADKGLDIQSFYTKEEAENSAIFDDYYILETILTAPHPSVTGFDEMGYPVYAEETRRDEDILCFTRAQQGIEDYFKTYLALCPRNARKENKKLDETFLSLIHAIQIMDSDFLELKVEDPFFKRVTDITDVL